MELHDLCERNPAKKYNDIPCRQRMAVPIPRSSTAAQTNTIAGSPTCPPLLPPPPPPRIAGCCPAGRPPPVPTLMHADGWPGALASTARPAGGQRPAERPMTSPVTSRNGPARRRSPGRGAVSVQADTAPERAASADPGLAPRMQVYAVRCRYAGYLYACTLPDLTAVVCMHFMPHIVKLEFDLHS